MALPNLLHCRLCGRASTARTGLACACSGRPVAKIDDRVEQLLRAVLAPAAPLLRIFHPETEWSADA